MVDRDNETWVAELKGLRGKQRQENAWQDLGNVLLSFIHWYLYSRVERFSGQGPPGGDDLDQLAQDIVQDSLFHIWRKGLQLYQGRAKFRTFAIAIAINQVRQNLRQVKRRREQLPPSFEDEDGEEEASLSLAVRAKMVLAELSPEEQAMLREIVQLTDCILTGQCSPREQGAFVRKHLNGLSSREIAQAMGATERAVNLLTFNVRQKLRRGLEEKGYTLSVILAILSASKISTGHGII